MHSTAHLDTPSDITYLQPSFTPCLEESATPNIVLSEKPSVAPSDVPTGKPSDSHQSCLPVCHHKLSQENPLYLIVSHHQSFYTSIQVDVSP